MTVCVVRLKEGAAPAAPSASVVEARHGSYFLALPSRSTTHSSNKRLFGPL